MTITIEATYANGVLRPSQPLPLAENEKVQVTVMPAERHASAVTGAPSESPPAGQMLGEEIAALVEALPPEVVDTWPTDGASQHDHYIYGTPKRTDLPE
jgi:predicted DNA-binding antitoxin AbrB/MazE fold protein